MEKAFVVICICMSLNAYSSWDSLYSEADKKYRQRNYIEADLMVSILDNDTIDNYHKGMLYNLKGQIYYDTKFYNHAIVYFKKSYASIHHHISLANISYAYLNLNQYDSAYYYLHRSLKGLTPSQKFYNQVYFAKNMRDHSLIDAYSLIENIMVPDSSPVLDRYYLIKGEYEKSKYNLNLALKYSSNDYIRVQALESLGDIDTANRITHYLQAVEILDSLMITENNYPSRLEAVKQQQKVFNKLIKHYLDNEEKAFYYTERSKSAALKMQLIETGKITTGDEIKSIKQIQEGLSANELILEYKHIDDMLLVFEIWKKGEHMQILKADKEQLSLISDFKTALFNQNIPGHDINRFIKASTKLYNYLLNYNVLKKNLVIVPDEIIYGIPFDILLTDTSVNSKNYADLPYLIKKHTVRYLYSASLNGAFKPGTGKFIHIIGDSRKLGKLQSPKLLSENLTHEIDNYSVVKNPFPNQSLFESKKYVHIDAHGTVNKDSSLYSFIEFEDANLYVKDIIEMNVNADLVSLASCNSGDGVFQPGEGFVSLERAFIYAGTKTVVSSLWEALDTVVPDIFTSFYINLQKGKSPEKAMQLAKVEFINSSNRFIKPVCWANYSVIGQKKSPGIWPGLRFGLYTALGIFILFFLFRFRKC